MAEAVAGLTIDLTTQTVELTQGFQQATRAIRKFTNQADQSLAVNDRVNTSMRTMAATAVLLAGLAGFGSLARSAEGFNQEMAKSTAIMGDLSDEMRDNLGAAAKRVAFDTKFSTAEAAESYFFLASAGLDAVQSIQALPQVAAFAQAGMFDMARATDLATDAQSALGLISKDAAQNLKNLTRVTDVLVGANTLANGSAEQFSEALTTKAGAALRLLGKDVEEGAAVLGVFADQGVKGAEAGTALAIVLRDLQTKAIKNAGAFAAANVRVFDAEGEFRNLADVVADLERAMGGLSDEAAKSFILDLGFSDKSVAFLQQLIGTSSQILEYERQMRSFSGITREVAEKNIPEFTRALNRLATLKDIFASDFIGPALEATGRAINLLIDALRGLRGTTSRVAVGLGLFVAAWVAFAAIIPTVMAAFRAVIGAYRALAGAQTIVQALSGPKGWAVLAAGAAIAAGSVLAVTHAFDSLSMEMEAAAKTSTDASTTMAAGMMEVDKEVLGVAASTDEAAKRFEKLKDKAADLQKSLQTPEEKFQNDVSSTLELFDAGLIGLDTWNRAIAKFRKELSEAEESARAIREPVRLNVGAVTRRSTAGFSAVHQARFNLTKLEAIEKRALVEHRRHSSLLEAILKKPPGPAIARADF